MKCEIDEIMSVLYVARGLWNGSFANFFFHFFLYSVFARMEIEIVLCDADF